MAGMIETHADTSGRPPTREAVHSPRYVTDPVVDWNDVAIEAILVDSKPRNLVPLDENTVLITRDQDGVTRASRAMAMVHAAMYNAVVGLVGGYRPYIRPPYSDLPERPAQPDLAAAVGSAARTILSWLYPSQRRHFDQAFLDIVGRSREEPSIRPSITFGYNVAVRVWNTRVNDGSNRRRPYNPPRRPGLWRPDLVDPAQKALDPHWGRVEPFLISQADVEEILRDLGPPPGYKGQAGDGYPAAYDLSDPAYREAREEVLVRGAPPADGNSTDPRKLNAVFWSYDEGRGTPVRLYNQALRSIAFASNLDVVGHARLFLYGNLVMADAAIVAWRIKYEYGLWRPVHAANLDELDPVRWIPFGKRPPYPPRDSCSPPFPAYVSGHSTLGNAVFNAAAHALAETGQASSGVTLATDEPPRVCVAYPTLGDAARANDESRIDLGVHFRFDTERGAQAGAMVEKKARDGLPEGTGVSKAMERGEQEIGPPFEVVDYREFVGEAGFASIYAQRYADEAREIDEVR
ncbi:MAG: hypothetical protein AVDCRST_MAG68-5724 [uncultured Gemmatimonadetes bacterium]|uniref:Phosphatidic acid phosphatase type 2/haloperoxidase domain-containing protein n=1 Tax=uncultured Gemmatimonadota bacterium TaxID=203437 RepID=A0A6J4MWF9_9BACT|nr:MAG: hypothetical protein AVDCRST_MAG68-5724 [uncultured Gemmatimonadota bacterium]